MTAGGPIAMMGRRPRTGRRAAGTPCRRKGSPDVDFSLPALLVSFVFGAIGLGVFTYGKRQARMLLVVGGLALMIYPVFVPGWRLALVIGALLTAGVAAAGWLRIDL